MVHRCKETVGRIVEQSTKEKDETFGQGVPRLGSDPSQRPYVLPTASTRIFKPASCINCFMYLATNTNGISQHSLHQTASHHNKRWVESQQHMFADFKRLATKPS